MSIESSRKDGVDKVASKQEQARPTPELGVSSSGRREEQIRFRWVWVKVRV